MEIRFLGSGDALGSGGRLAQIGADRVILTHMSAEMLACRAEVNLACAEDGLAIEL